MFICDIYAFHMDIGDVRLNETVPLWLSVWRKHGWTPHIIGMEEALRHPDFSRLWRMAESMPTVNDKMFSVVNFVRWCAFAGVNGVVTDYDVLPRVPFPPRDFETFFSGDRDNGPGFLAGLCSDFDRVVQLILNYSIMPDDIVRGQPHVCDMTILRRHPELYLSKQDLVRCYGVHGWQDVPLTHFGNAYLNHDESKREQMIEILKAEGGICE